MEIKSRLKFSTRELVIALHHTKYREERKVKLELYDGGPCLNEGQLKVKCSQYLSCNKNERFKSHKFSYFVLNLGFIEITKLIIHKKVCHA